MNFNHPQDNFITDGQSPGFDPKTSKRSSGLFSFFKWFKSSPSRESSIPDLLNSSSSSCDSINSGISTGTAASFSFVSPKSYQTNVVENKSIVPGPETDTYKARLKDRDKRREKDKNLTLRKKYNLFFNRETLFRSKTEEEEDSSRSLPLMTRKKAMEVSDEESKLHRRTNSESSKLKKAGAYCHVKGKRKAPQPPLNKSTESTLSLRRKKKMAPPPPADKLKIALDSLEYADADIICNDSLKLDHGVLKPATENISATSIYSMDSTSSTKTEKSTDVSSVSPRPWYKRNPNRDSSFFPKKEPFKSENKYEPIQDHRSTASKIEDKDVKSTKMFGNSKDESKRKSGMTFLTNISELDREATEIIKKEQCQAGEFDNPPPFMRPKEEEPKNTDSWISPKRKSAKDLIAKFNAITNVTKVTVNSAFFGSKDPGIVQRDNFKRDYFGRQLSVKDEMMMQQNKLNNKKLSDKYFGKVDSQDKNIVDNNNKPSAIPLMKSESASVITNKSDKKGTPKLERKSWNCPKCSIENEYWRIICHVCSTIKPYFDDLGAPSPKNNSLEKNKIDNTEKKQYPSSSSSSKDNYSKYTSFKTGSDTPHFERSKTQIGFSALSKINQNKNKENKFVKSISSSDDRTTSVVSEENKKEEREKLKKMLIDMKNSLPKKKNEQKGQNFRSSIIQENAENVYEETKNIEPNKDVILLDQKSNKIQKENKTIVESNIGVIPPKKTELNKNLQATKLPIKVEEEKKAISSKEIFFKDNKNKNEIDISKTKTDKINNQFLAKDNKDNRAEKVTEKNNSKNEQKSSTDIIKTQKLFDENKTAQLKGNKVAEVIIETTETIYENIKVKRKDSQKPAKVSSAVQTNGVIRQFIPENILNLTTPVSEKNPKYELLRPNDFENIYNEKTMDNDMGENHIYANLIENGNLFLNMPVNLKDIRNNTANNTDTLEIGRLLKRLESAIAKGDLGEAANYARELAQLKVNCSVIRQKSEEEKANARTEDKTFTIHMYVEDKLSHRGPFPLKVRGSMTLKELKLRVEREFEIPADVQKWIIGKQLASNDNGTLNEMNVYDEETPLFLYLVAPQKIENKITVTEVPSTSSNLKLLNEKTEKSELEIKLKPAQNNNSNGNNVKEKVSANTKKEFNVNETAIVSSQSAINNEKGKNKVNDSKNKVNDNSEVVNGPKLDVVSTIQEVNHAKDGIEEYEVKTLKPRNDEFWECSICTLLNLKNINICAVCNTVRRITLSPTITETDQPQKVARSRKYKAPQPQVSKTKEHYLQLVNLDNADLVENVETFECLICFLEIEPGKGVTLRECLHQFCKSCLADTIQFSDEAEVKCPYRDDQYSCDIALQDREVKALVSTEVYDQYLGKSVTQAENKIDKSFHCKTPDCKGWCIFEDNVNEFKCPVCRRVNCLTCQAIHMGLNCKEYQERMHQDSNTDENAKRTKVMLDEMVNKGEALTCPTCQVILMKKWGCDWLRCSMCKTEICWVTKGPRWGPAGKGDISGGCQCGVNGIKCHPQCNYCH